jgi:hypothetical protein
VKTRLSSRLSPGAKKRLLAAVPGEVVRCLISVAPATDVDGLRRALAERGATVHSWVEETRLLTAEIPAERLAEAGDLPGVVYVEAATGYSR